MKTSRLSLSRFLSAPPLIVGTLFWLGLANPSFATLVTAGDDIGMVSNVSEVLTGGGITVASGPGSLTVNLTAGTAPLGTSFVNFTNPSNLLELNLPASNDTLTVSAFDSLFNAAFLVNALAGDDTVIINAITGTGLYTMDGGADTDILDVRGLGLTASDTGTNILLGGVSVISYSNFESVLLAVRPAPEPTTLALFGLALAGLGFARRRLH